MDAQSPAYSERIVPASRTITVPPPLCPESVSLGTMSCVVSSRNPGGPDVHGGEDVPFCL